jgi:hypothetical protein
MYAFDLYGDYEKPMPFTIFNKDLPALLGKYPTAFLIKLIFSFILNPNFNVFLK